MDVQYPLLVVATAGRHIQIYNLTNPSTPYKVGPCVMTHVQHPLKSPYSDHNISLKVADSCSLLLHQLGE